MLKIAVVYEDDSIFVEFEPNKFRRLLKTYTEELGDVGLALDKIEQEIKKETRTA